MKKINFAKDILPHAIAVGVFLIITVLFFNPVFFKNQSLNQHDIQEFEGTSKQIQDFREKTGEEALWTDAVFSGMPAYLISVKWGSEAISFMKRVLTLWLPHPVNSIFMAFVCYYIMLLAFGVRPYLAITGAIAFGLSSFVIIGLGAGHNARIAAIALMPLVIAGIHLTFSGKRILGFGLTTAALALHLRENHIQITYYLTIIILAYGIVQLIDALRTKKLPDFITNVAILIPAVIIAAGTFFGQFWAITEYTSFSIRGKNELVSPNNNVTTGLTKEYAFAYTYGIWEPMTLLIPDFYGGSSMKAFVEDKKSESFKVLSQASDNKLANQLAPYTVNYWGPGTGGPYYSGAIIIFLFVLGIVFAERKYVYWLVSVGMLSIMLSWGDSFSTFNYFIFDHLPGYNKFRSFNFALIIIFLAMPLLGLLGLERLISTGLDKAIKKKLLIVFAITGGLCLLLILFAGMLGFMKTGENQLPVWFTNALVDDRKSLFRADAFRSMIFITLAFLLVYFEMWKKISPIIFFSVLAILTAVDLAAVDKRYFTKDNFQRKHENAMMAMTEADQEILKDKSMYRVYNLQSPMAEARTSYYHNSIGGYHGAKMKRYLDLYDSCMAPETNRLIEALQLGKLDFSPYGTLNMLNIKYVVYGPNRDNIIPNAQANGNAWFVQNVVAAKSPNEELEKTCGINTKTTAVINDLEFKTPEIKPDSTSRITLVEHQPNFSKYETQSAADGLAVFSEIYYPKGWLATLDGKDVPILRANYILRALAIPSGKHTLEFKFKPDAYFIGNKVSMASSWLTLLILLGSLGWTFKKKGE